MLPNHNTARTTVFIANNAIINPLFKSEYSPKPIMTRNNAKPMTEIQQT